MARLLVLGGSRQAVRGLEHLHKLGIELVICDIDPTAPGFEFASDRILASVYHAEDCIPAVVRYHKAARFDGVMCLACDVPHIVARIAEQLGLPGIEPAVADLTVDKVAMKDRFRSCGVNVPEYQLVTEARQLTSLLDQWGGLVVKPVDSRGSKGVSRLLPGGDHLWAFSHAFENSPSGRVIAEQYLVGPQVSTESVVIEGQAVTPAMSDRSYELLEMYAPYIVENGGDMPCALGAATTEAIAALIQRGTDALGLRHGIIKGDIVVHNGKPYIIELAARLSGGYFCTHQIPFSTGVNLVEAAARIALGEKLSPEDWTAKFHKPVSTRWLIPPPGRIVSFVEAEQVRNVEGVLAFEHWTQIGAMVGGAENAAASVAMVQATGKDREQAIKNAERALDAFGLTVEAA